MRLSQIIDTDSSIEITGLTADSRSVKKGYLFAALPGRKADGANYIADALMHGASAILAPEGTVLPEGASALLFTDPNPRLALSKAAAAYYQKQPDFVAAVTGTSGKTSTVSFAQQLWSLSGVAKSASLGTLGVRGPGMVRSGSLTTPDTVSLHAELADLAAAGVTHLALEASSHGLDQYRLDHVRVKTAAYTNLSHDHLDYHVDMDAYFRAKTRLFSEILPKDGTAVLYADDPYSERIIEICRMLKHQIITVGQKGQDIRIISRKAMPLGQELIIEVFGKTYEVLLPLVGEFQVSNVLCALGIVISSGITSDLAVSCIPALQGVPGRLQLVSGHPSGAAIYVDYAHKPAAVEAVLKTVRPHTKGRLICLIGCGGDRDPFKRPVMGRVAATLADLVIVTDDNPRSEDPERIRAAVCEGAPDAVEIEGRENAISYAIDALKGGDVLVIAGKGHEQGQIFNNRVEPFDDVAVAEKFIKKIKGGK